MKQGNIILSNPDSIKLRCFLLSEASSSKFSYISIYSGQLQKPGKQNQSIAFRVGCAMESGVTGYTGSQWKWKKQVSFNGEGNTERRRRVK